MSAIVDRSYFTELAAADPERLCRKSGCSHDRQGRSYTIDIWDWQYVISPEQQTFQQVKRAGAPPHQYFDLVCIYSLLRRKEIPLSGEWISEKDLPGGVTFFRGPHLIPTDLISNHFGDDLQGFCTRCEQLSGKRMAMADASYSFDITPDIPVAVLYWAGDEDFPAEAKLLYDSSIAQRMTLDILFALAVGVCSRIGMESA